ncbi:MAG: alpha/beta hydrolase [Methanobacteriota archaeon]|nr:MAG: alpha/beta hydrolase [Euryarchaeota archaeon]
MSFLSTLIITVVVLYLISVIIVFWMLTNNIFIWRSKDYLIPFGTAEDGSLKKGWLEPEGIRYWICRNPNQVDDRWVVLLHSWGRNSARMVSRGEIYWDRGYSLVFVDAWSHGQSKYRKTTTALWFAEHAMKICEIEGIESPIVHGLSFGALASTIFASRKPVRAVIAEALLHDIRGMYEGFMRVLHIPRILYWWIVVLILRMDFPWKEIEPKFTLPRLDMPIFLIHGAKDSMFPPERDFQKNISLLKENDWYWLVPNSLHSKMEFHPDHSRMINEFLDHVENGSQSSAQAIRSSIIIDN